MKRKIIKDISCFIIGGLFMIISGCTSSFDDINTNPDASGKVTPAMLATKLIVDHASSGHSSHSEFLRKSLFNGDGMNSWTDYQYNKLYWGGFGQIRNLTNAQKMVELASERNKEAYLGLFYYLKGYTFYRTTLEMGDIPYSQALQASEFPYPKYDNQKDVFAGILNDLALADKHFAAAVEGIDGDPIYGGDSQKWRKAVNVLRLKVLMSLSKRADDTPELKVKETFGQIVAEGNLFESNQDNLQIVYSNVDGQKNPLHVTETIWVHQYIGTSTLIDPLRNFKDYRLFYYFAPMEGRTNPADLPEGETLLTVNDWAAYEGLDVAGVFIEEQKKMAKKMHCQLHHAYRKTFEGIPAIRLGYADMNFILAEAAEMGWINGPAKEYYDKGVKASFDFIKSTCKPTEKQTMLITDEYITNYLDAADTKYPVSGTSLDRLKQIYMQTYIASFLHLAWDSYFDFRRTGYPEYPINPDSNLNDDKTKIPVRWLYPSDEFNYNKENLLEALDRQWGGAENTNSIMWLIK